MQKVFFTSKVNQQRKNFRLW